ncbi:hypothetical protein Tco_0469367 [Tanacetum coccineum]
MPYPFEGDSSPLYIKQQWDGPHFPENNILCKDIFRDPNVCRKALDQTITPAELRRTESLLPFELSNRVNVLSALLVSHGMELNTRYTNLENKELRSRNDVSSEELKRLQAQLADAKASFAGLTDELARTDAKLSDHALVVRNLLLSSDEFHDALAHVASLGISSRVERRLCMGRTDAEFKVVVQNVSNFSIGAEAEFNKSLAAFPSIQFPFHGKVVAAAEGALSEVTQILPDKLVRSATPIFNASPVVSEALDQSLVDHASDRSPYVA